MIYIYTCMFIYIYVCIYVYLFIYIYTHMCTLYMYIIILEKYPQLMAALRQGKVAQQLQDASKRLKPRLKRSFSDTAVSKKKITRRAGGSGWFLGESRVTNHHKPWLSWLIVSYTIKFNNEDQTTLSTTSRHRWQSSWKLLFLSCLSVWVINPLLAWQFRDGSQGAPFMLGTAHRLTVSPWMSYPPLHHIASTSVFLYPLVN